MGTCIEKLPHSCGSSDGLQVFADEEGNYNGFCFACRKPVADPYKDKPEDYAPPTGFKKSQEEIEAEIREIQECSPLDLPDRKLEKEYLEYFGIRVGVSQVDGTTPEFYYFPYEREGGLSAYKTYLIEGKKMWTVGSMKEVDLFGWSQALATGAKTLYITEGEFDAVALFKIFKEENRHTQYASFNPAICSLPTGAGAAKTVISRLLPKIRKAFKEVVLVFDMDDPGKKARDDVVRIMPNGFPVKCADLPAKDANDCLIQGRSKACFKAVKWQAGAVKNTRLVLGSSLREEARKQAEWGYSWPWEGMTQTTRGIRLGETIYIGAGVKMGKSEVVNAIASHLILEHGWPVLLAKPEESNKKTYQMLVGKAAGKIFHDPNQPFDYKAYDEAEPLIGDKAILLDLYQHIGWETLKDDITAAAAMGAKAVFIDPITNLTNQLSSGEANDALVRIASELSAMAMDLNIVVFIFCHLKAPTNGESHERGGKVHSTQFAGSRAMMRSCNLMIGVEGNKDPDIPKEERNIRTLVVLEDREFGSSARIPLYWDDKTGLFNEMRKA